MPPKPTVPRSSPRSSAPPARSASVNGARPQKPEHKILFQKYFKSIGPRTYAAQIKEASNKNHYLVLTEGKRDLTTGEVKKTRLFIYSEDFGTFFRMLHETAQFIKAHPVPEEIKIRRQRYWAKKEAEQAAAAREAAAAAKPIQPTKITAPKAPPRRTTRGR